MWNWTPSKQQDRVQILPFIWCEHNEFQVINDHFWMRLCLFCVVNVWYELIDVHTKWNTIRLQLVFSRRSSQRFSCSSVDSESWWSAEVDDARLQIQIQSEVTAERRGMILIGHMRTMRLTDVTQHCCSFLPGSDPEEAKEGSKEGGREGKSGRRAANNRTND